MNKIIFISIVLINTHYIVTQKPPTTREDEAFQLTRETLVLFTNMFSSCVKSKTENQGFTDLNEFVLRPSRTTVGFPPKLISNRKFFANMISTPAFRNMLEKDEEQLRKSYITKLRFCDTVTMDKDMVKIFYDREVDQSKM